MEPNLKKPDLKYTGKYECEYRCGFESTDFNEVEVHESTCKDPEYYPEHSSYATGLLRAQDQKRAAKKKKGGSTQARSNHSRKNKTHKKKKTRKKRKTRKRSRRSSFLRGSMKGGGTVFHAPALAAKAASDAAAFHGHDVQAQKATHHQTATTGLKDPRDMTEAQQDEQQYLYDAMKIDPFGLFPDPSQM